MDFNRFSTDTTAEVEGKWFPLGDGEIKVARTGNNRYREALRTKVNLHGEEMNKGLMELDISDDLLCEVIAATILLDWKNFTDEGKPCAYSKETAKAMLLKYRDFRDIVVSKADNMENFRKVQGDKDRGNSSADSAGTSPTATTSPSTKA